MREAQESTGRSMDGVSREPRTSKDGGAARIGKKMPAGDRAHKRVAAFQMIL